MLHMDVKIMLKNVLSGRRGHVVMANRISNQCTLTFLNDNLKAPSVSVDVPVGQILVIRYYGDLDYIICETVVM